MGGITDGFWSPRSDLNLELQFISVKHNLGLILRSTLGGRLLEEVHLLDDNIQGSLDEESLLPSGLKHVFVKTLSVFTPGKTILRRVAACETMDAYDLEMTTQKELEVFSKSFGLDLSLDFVEQVPGKVLLGCVTALCTAAWVTSGDQTSYNEGHEMTGMEISLLDQY